MKHHLNRLICIGLLCCGTTSWALPADVMHFDNNSRVTLSASTQNINRIFVKNDKITQHIAPVGAFIFDKTHNADGSVFFKPLDSHTALTVYFTTEAGQHFSARIKPVKESGKTIEMIPNTPAGPMPRWEKNSDYLTLLQTLMTAMIKDQSLSGFGVHVIKKPQDEVLTPTLSMALTQIYTGQALQGFCYRITNTGSQAVLLEARQFWHPGVRAVHTQDQTLQPHQQSVVQVLESRGA